MTQTPPFASCVAWSLLLLSAGIGAVRLQGREIVMKEAEGGITSSKFGYDPLTGIDPANQMTLMKLFQEAVRNNGDKFAFQTPWQDAHGNLTKKKFWEKNTLGAYEYDTTTWRQYHKLVMQAAAAFVNLGLKPMDAVNIRGVNSEEWLVAFMGCIAAGGLPVGLYPTDSPAALKFKAKDSGAAFIVLGKAADVAIYSGFNETQNNSELPKIILWDSNRQFPAEPPKDSVDKLGPEHFFRWADFMNKGDEDSMAKVEQRIKDQMPGQAGTVVYTSGTTGNPKGVMLSQDALASSAMTISDQLVTKTPPGGQFRSISFMPLNHIAGQMMDIIAPMYISSQKSRYSTVFFPAMCYLKQTCSKETIKDAKPVIFLGVPEVWDGFKTKIEQALANMKMGLNKIVTWKFMLKQMGMNKVMYAISGAGAIKPDTISFFSKAGINILNMYASSESSALGTAWTNEDFQIEDIEKKFGSIGKAVGNEVRLDQWDEIMLRGRNTMLGYLNSEHKTREAFINGWLMTGDKGRIDDDGFVFLTGRLKDIMKIAGEMIAPEAVELGIMAACNADGETILKRAIVVGDNKQYISVLINLLQRVGSSAGDLTGAAKKVDINLASQTVKDAKGSVVWNKRLSDCIKKYNKVAPKGQEAVFRYLILPEDISPDDSDLMTPTFKIKREGVNKFYKDEIEKCGGDDALENKKAGPQPC